jgi:hypothetical protein
MTGAEAVGIGLGFLAVVAPEFWPKMPRALSLALAGIGLSWLTYSGILGIESLSHAKLQYGPLATIIAGAVFIATGLFWHFNRDRSHVDEAPHEKRSSVDGTIKLECSFEKFEFPNDGKLLEFITSDDEARTVGLQSAWMTIENYRAHPDAIPTVYGMINKCRITNYNPWPVFNVGIATSVEFAKKIPIAPNSHEQHSLETKAHQFSIPEVSANGTIDIFVWNLTKYIVFVRFPSEIELQKLGETKRETAKLIPAQNMVVMHPAGNP